MAYQPTPRPPCLPGAHVSGSLRPHVVSRCLPSSLPLPWWPRYPLVNGLTHLSHQLPSYVQDAEHSHGWIGHLLRRFRLAAWAARNAPKLQSPGDAPGQTSTDLRPGRGVAGGDAGNHRHTHRAVPARGPKMRQGVLGLMSPEQAVRYTRIAGEINQSVTGYVLGDLLTFPPSCSRSAFHLCRRSLAGNRPGTVAGQRTRRTTRRRARDRAQSDQNNWPGRQRASAAR